MFYSFTKNLKRIVENPYLNLAIGLFLLYSGISETVYELKNVNNFRIGVHHGVILFAILHILKILPHLTEGMEHIEKIGEKKNG
jgi:hypothetical protein